MTIPSLLVVSERMNSLCLVSRGWRDWIKFVHLLRCGLVQKTRGSKQI